MRMHFFFLWFASALMLLAGCSGKEPDPDSGSGQDAPGESICLVVNAPGEWSGTDCIGLFMPSSGVENIKAGYGEKGFSATVPTPVKGAMVSAYYPYTEKFDKEGLNVRIPEEADGEITVSSPLVAAPVSLNEIKASSAVDMEFIPVVGTVRIRIADCKEESLAGGKVSGVVLSTDREIAGLYSVDVPTGDLIPVSRSNTITVKSDKEISTDGVSYVVSALPGKYTGRLTITTSFDEQSFPSLSFEVKAGETVDVSCELTAPVKPHAGIYSAEDFNAFVASLVAGDISEWITPETGEVDIREDLTFVDPPVYPKGEESTVVTFNGVINGNGHSITCEVWEAPLLNVIGKDGVVKNLVTKGSFKRMLNSGGAGNATIARVNLGLIQKCSADVSVNLETTGGTILGAICAQNGGTVKECVNLGSITVTGNYTVAGGGYGGGISALGHSILGSSSPTFIDVDGTCAAGTFIDCENRGDITFIAAGKKVTKSSFGGICGLVYMDGVKFVNCVNRGTVARISDGEETSTACNSVGGILGRCSAWYTISPGDSGALDNGGVNGYSISIDGCSNYGKVYTSCRHSGGVARNSSGARLDAAGGIVGSVIGRTSSHSVISGCSNEGEVTGGWNTFVNTTVLGGITGLARFTDISSCISRGKLSAISQEKPMGAAGGIVAFAIEDVSITGGTVNVPMALWRAPSKPLLYGLAFGNVVTSASISGTAIGGTISVDGSSVTVTQNDIVSSESNVMPEVSGINWN